VRENWDSVIKQLEKRCETLSHRKISIKGRAVLANTFLLSKAWYVARIFSPPPDVMKQMKKLIVAYVWDGKHQSVSTDTLFKPLQSGGIGLLPILLQSQCLQLSDLVQVGEISPPPWIFFVRYWISSKIFKLKPEWNFLNSNLTPRRVYGRIPFHLDSLLGKLRTCVKENLSAARDIRRHLTPKFEEPRSLPSSLSNLQCHVKYAINFKTLIGSNFSTIGYPRSAETYFFFVHNALPCLYNLKHWYGGRPSYQNDNCKLCNKVPETIVHVFLCPMWIPVWQFVVETLQPKIRIKSLLNLLLPAKPSDRSQSLNLVTFSAMRNIWLARNRIVLGKKTASPDWIIFRIKSELKSSLERYFSLHSSARGIETFSKTFGALATVSPSNTLIFSFL